MDKMTQAMLDITDMDMLAKMDSVIHRRHPLVKMIVTIAYIFVVVSFPKEQLSALLPMVLFPVFMFAASGISVKTCFYKLRFILPLLCFVGIWNPLFDKTPVLMLGRFTITGGMISFVTLMLKGVFALMASYLLIATTGIEKICYGLNLLHVPDVLVTQILITYRYISLLLKEAATMVHAYALRAPGQKGLHISVWGSFVGQLLLRSMDRAQNLYQSMQLRGFTGSFYYARDQKAKSSDYLYLVICCALFILLRRYNLPVFIGNLFYK